MDRVPGEARFQASASVISTAIITTASRCTTSLKEDGKECIKELNDDMITSAAFFVASLVDALEGRRACHHISNGGGLFAILPTSIAERIFSASTAAWRKTYFLYSCVAVVTRKFGIKITDLVIRREHRWEPGQFRNRASWTRT